MGKISRNNFDKSSTGVDIESLCMRDGDASRRDFEESIEIVQYNGYTTTSIGYYKGGEVPQSHEIKFAVKGERQAREKYFLEAGRYYEAGEVKGWDDETLDSEILALEEDVSLINYALDRLPTIEGLEFVPNKNLITLTTRGYSQGDYARVIYCPEDLETAWGRMPTQEEMQKTVDRLYWDCPVYARVEVNGEEYQYWDMPDVDSYEWEREKFIAWVAKESGVPVESLESVIPRDLDYSD